MGLSGMERTGFRCALQASENLTFLDNSQPESSLMRQSVMEGCLNRIEVERLKAVHLLLYHKYLKGRIQSCSSSLCYGAMCIDGNTAHHLHDKGGFVSEHPAAPVVHSSSTPMTDGMRLQCAAPWKLVAVQEKRWSTAVRDLAGS